MSNNNYINIQGPYKSITSSSEKYGTVTLSKLEDSYNTIANTFADMSVVNQIADKLNRQNRLEKRNRWRNTRLKRK